MSKTSKYQAAFLQYRTDQIAAQRLHDPDLTPEANRKRQADARAAARAKLREAIPQRPEGPDPRDTVLATLTPNTADDIAVLGREREKIEHLLSRGAHVSQIIDQADERRLAAVLDWLETSDQVQDSPDPAAAQAELRGEVFTRLAVLGHEDTRQAAEQVAERETLTAWHDVLQSLADGTEPEYGPRALLHQRDRDGYAGTFGMQLPTADRQTLAEADRHAAQDAAREQAVDRQRDRMGADQ